ncbi:MAG: hypothetical protein ACRDD7_15085 [Peptostreptococcaceae bacterium]
MTGEINMDRLSELIEQRQSEIIIKISEVLNQDGNTNDNKINITKSAKDLNLRLNETKKSLEGINELYKSLGLEQSEETLTKSKVMQKIRMDKINIIKDMAEAALRSKDDEFIEYALEEINKTSTKVEMDYFEHIDVIGIQKLSERFETHLLETRRLLKEITGLEIQE